MINGLDFAQVSCVRTILADSLVDYELGAILAFSPNYSHSLDRIPF